MLSLNLEFSSSRKFPLYMRLYRGLLAGISSGEIAGGQRLPSKRALSADLGLSVNTVDQAYQMLAAEGYIEARPRSGFYARQIERLELPGAGRPLPSPVEEGSDAAPAIDFGTGAADPSLFPYKTWGRIQREDLSHHPELLSHGPREGDAGLRLAIARYLHEYRGVNCSAGQIIIGAGMEYLLGLISNLLFDRTFALEDPGYPRVADILRNNRVEHVFIPVGADGLEIAPLRDSGSDIVYVTPSHQFPTGATMPVARRRELLTWAGEATGRYIIEDDYDSEFRFDTRPIPSLQGLDGAGRVIYTGTFSRCLSPSVRVAYMVLPKSLIAPYRERFSRYSSTVSRFEQRSLQRFIEEGYFARHLGRARTSYRARRDVLLRELTAAFSKENIETFGAHTGLHLVLRLNTPIGEQELIQRAKDAGIRLTGMGEYRKLKYTGSSPSIIIGYSAVGEDTIKEGCARLKAAWGF